jgi:hypothetical protein
MRRIITRVMKFQGSKSDYDCVYCVCVGGVEIIIMCVGAQLDVQGNKVHTITTPRSINSMGTITDPRFGHIHEKTNGRNEQ